MWLCNGPVSRQHGGTAFTGRTRGRGKGMEQVAGAYRTVFDITEAQWLIKVTTQVRLVCSTS